MVGKNLPQRRSDLRSPAHLTSIESDEIAVKSEHSGESIGIALIKEWDELQDVPV